MTLWNLQELPGKMLFALPICISSPIINHIMEERRGCMTYAMKMQEKRKEDIK